jgi:hypothetical protein
MADQNIRTGDVIGLKANPIDPEGNPAIVTNTSWAVLGSTGFLSLATSTAGALYQKVTAIKPTPSDRTVQFTCNNQFGNQANGFRSFKVIDASGLRMTFSQLNNVGVEWISGNGSTDGYVRLRPYTSDTGGKTLRMSVYPVDGGGVETMPAYVLSSYKAHAALGGANILVDGLMAPTTSTSTDRHFDLTLVTGGTDTVYASAVTSLGTTIYGSVRITIAAAVSSSLSTSAKAL